MIRVQVQYFPHVSFNTLLGASEFLRGVRGKVQVHIGTTFLEFPDGMPSTPSGVQVCILNKLGEALPNFEGGHKYWWLHVSGPDGVDVLLAEFHQHNGALTVGGDDYFLEGRWLHKWEIHYAEPVIPPASVLLA